MTNIDLRQTSGLPLEYDERDKRLVSHEILLPTPEMGEFHITYRGVKIPNHSTIFKDNRVRHDITIIPPGKLDNRWAATPALSSGAYEVLNGTGHFLLQNAKESLHMVARPGERFVIPKGFEHCAINASHDTLIVSSMISEGRGQADVGFRHTAIARGEGLEFVKHKKTPELKRHEPTTHKGFGPIGWKHMYHTFVTMPERFQFLNDSNHKF